VTAKPKPRVEVYEAVRPDGSRVRVVRDIDTGERTVEPVPEPAGAAGETG
jgi:hypothetical protein